jgi:hypothetical protein
MGRRYRRLMTVRKGAYLLPVLVTLALPVRPACAQDASSPQPASQPSEFRGFVSDVAHDYWNFVSSMENARFAAGGVAAAATVHFGDQHFAQETAHVSTFTANTLKPADTYGNLAFQFPMALTWWIIGHAKGSERGADAGRDLVRAQISGASFAYVLKYAVNRTRPNGDPRSFPSGHATAAFATATVLQEHYGWKLGLPFYALATYTAIDRVTLNKHWPSDVTFGAALGMMCGRTITLHVRRERIELHPQAVPGGGGVVVNVRQ